MKMHLLQLAIPVFTLGYSMPLTDVVKMGMFSLGNIINIQIQRRILYIQ